jgi:putative FmdB family regulatory protein
MPIFEYTCSKCGTTFEKLVFKERDERRECPKCGSKRVERLFSAFSTTTIASGKATRNSCVPSGGS